MLKRVLVSLVAACTLSASSLAFAAEQTHIQFVTSAGNFEIALDDEKAPETVKNFKQYVTDKFYDDTTFHRVIPGFMVQGGGFTADLTQKPTRPPVKNEADNGLRNVRGTISMARTADVNSATSQFFINVADNAFLDHGQRDFGYAVFGKVVNGMDVVDKMSKVKTDNIGPYQNVPSVPIKIISATIIK
ncbi:peptidylprolyl isomerase A [Morganella psychrotolerans]|uniref:Peptidyl-prolyl cis-trans isomerase n=1 Tax=Morganella psychrotolerans TaxID=368603 RepID=A0A1B8H364_9GAMM|nr:peptidylprolyl isomerase A [Morganella psychrotolerans]OBU03517.1 peptidylprolyl isomerase [Morganella psychrotolerans]